VPVWDTSSAIPGFPVDDSTNRFEGVSPGFHLKSDSIFGPLFGTSNQSNESLARSSNRISNLLVHVLAGYGVHVEAKAQPDTKQTSGYQLTSKTKRFL